MNKIKVGLTYIFSVSVIGFLFAACELKEKNRNVEEKKPLEPELKFGFNLDSFHTIEGEVRKNKTFSDIMITQNIGYGKVVKIANEIRDSFDVRNIRVGQNYTILCSKDTIKKPEYFIYENSKAEYTILDMQGNSAVARRIKRDSKWIEKFASGIIESSLSESLSNQGVNYVIANELSEVYAWTVDFFRLHKGDKFKVIYEDHIIEDTLYAGESRIKSAIFEHRGEQFYSFEYLADSTKNIIEYFDEDGGALRRQFLRAPLKFSRISSRYNKRRFHPILKRVKPHYGTDYAAPYGTPITATANGTITKRSRTRGNGNYVKIRHNSVYSTQYLHMRNFKKGQRVGSFVKQGDIIGYVGSTGLATGPHVCYRFWKNGSQVDPLRQKLPKTAPIVDSLKSKYLKFIEPIKQELDNINYPIKAPDSLDVNPIS